MSLLTASQLRTRKKIKKRIYESNRGKISLLKTNRYLYVYVIDKNNKVLKSFTSKSKKIKGLAKNKDSIKEFLPKVIKYCNNNNIHDYAFDRSGYKYHGIIMEIADYLRNAKIII